jgi:hypothetical protein
LRAQTARTSAVEICSPDSITMSAARSGVLPLILLAGLLGWLIVRARREPAALDR